MVVTNNDALFYVGGREADVFGGLSEAARVGELDVHYRLQKARMRVGRGAMLGRT